MISIKKILITGNLGYIGPVLIHHLRKTIPNAYIAGFDNGYFSGCLVDPYLSNDHLYDLQIYGDVRSFDYGILEGYESVIYLSAISNDPMGNLFESQTMEINYLSACKLAQHAKNCGVKEFIFASSCSVYGAGGEDAKGENSPLNPLTAYAKSKVLSEEKLFSISSAEFSVTCLRFATACGASSRLRLDLVLNDFVASAYLKKHIEILSDGTPWRPLIDVNDMSRAILWALQRGTQGGNFVCVNTGSNEWNFSIKDLAIAVQMSMPNVSLSVNKNAPTDNRSYRVDFTCFKNLAKDHQPNMTLDRTIESLISQIKLAKFSDENFRKSHLIRLNALNTLALKNKIDLNLCWI